MLWLLSRLVVWPVKAVVGTAALGTKATAKTASGSAKLGYRTGRLFGYRNLVLLGLGVGVGLAVAPGPGRETREKVRARLVERGLLKDASSAGSSPYESPSALPDLAAASNGSSADGAAGARTDVAALQDPTSVSPMGVTTTASPAGLGDLDVAAEGPGPVPATDPLGDEPGGSTP